MHLLKFLKVLVDEEFLEIYHSIQIPYQLKLIDFPCRR